MTVDALTRIEDSDLELALRIRHFETSVLELIAAGEVGGTAHTCLGQEYIPVALAPLLAGDFIFSNHRGHGHYLAHFGDAAGLLAEIMGREGAVCSGVGGSQHLYREGEFLATGVQGQSLPVAVGMALDMRRKHQSRLAVAYIGDGTWGEGSVYEALNLAAVWQVPLLVVVEHNGIAQSTPTSMTMAGDIAGRAAAFGITHFQCADVDIKVIRAKVAPLIASARQGPHPLILEFSTQRLGPHSKGDDTRSAQELQRVRHADWLARYQEQFRDHFIAIDQTARESVRRLAEEVRCRAPSVWSPDADG